MPYVSKKIDVLKSQATKIPVVTKCAKIEKANNANPGQKCSKTVFSIKMTGTGKKTQEKTSNFEVEPQSLASILSNREIDESEEKTESKVRPSMYRSTRLFGDLNRVGCLNDKHIRDGKENIFPNTKSKPERPSMYRSQSPYLRLTAQKSLRAGRHFSTRTSTPNLATTPVESAVKNGEGKPHLLGQIQPVSCTPNGILKKCLAQEKTPAITEFDQTASRSNHETSYPSMQLITPNGHISQWIETTPSVRNVFSQQKSAKKHLRFALKRRESQELRNSFNLLSLDELCDKLVYNKKKSRALHACIDLKKQESINSKQIGNKPSSGVEPNEKVYNNIKNLAIQPNFELSDTKCERVTPKINTLHTPRAKRANATSLSIDIDPNESIIVAVTLRNHQAREAAAPIETPLVKRRLADAHFQNHVTKRSSPIDNLNYRSMMADRSDLSPEQSPIVSSEGSSSSNAALSVSIDLGTDVAIDAKWDQSCDDEVRRFSFLGRHVSTRVQSSQSICDRRNFEISITSSFHTHSDQNIERPLDPVAQTLTFGDDTSFVPVLPQDN